MNKLLYFVVIFDPHYKFSYVEWSFQQMYGEDPDYFLKEISTSVVESLSTMYNWYAATLEEHDRTGQTSHGPLEDVRHGVTSAPTEVPTYLARADAFKKHLMEKSSIDRKNELERYLDEACVVGNDKFELLVWWRQNSSRFPILSAMVKDVLATPVSTVASESAFSTGGRILDSFRSCLSPEVTEGLICTQNWLTPALYQLKDVNLNEELENTEKIVQGTDFFLFLFSLCFNILIW